MKDRSAFACFSAVSRGWKVEPGRDWVLGGSRRGRGNIALWPQSNAANNSSGNKLNFSKIEHTKNIFVFGVKYGNAPSKRKRRAAKEFLIWFSFGAAAQRSMRAPEDRRPQPHPQPHPQPQPHPRPRCPRRGIVCGALSAVVCVCVCVSGCDPSKEHILKMCLPFVTFATTSWVLDVNTMYTRAAVAPLAAAAGAFRGRLIGA